MSLAARRGLLRALTDHEVRFVLIGGMAVIAHGYVRATKDVDIVFDLAIDNCNRLADALGELRAEVTAADTLPPGGAITGEWLATGGQFVFATEYGQLDALSRMSLGQYEDLSAAASTTTLLDGAEVAVLSYDDLVRSKEAAGRDRDLLDIEELRRARGE